VWEEQTMYTRGFTHGFTGLAPDPVSECGG
jgi:hypothetical protein